MIPKYVEFRSTLPKTASGKIDKKKLRKDTNKYEERSLKPKTKTD